MFTSKLYADKNVYDEEPEKSAHIAENIHWLVNPAMLLGNVRTTIDPLLDLRNYHKGHIQNTKGDIGQIKILMLWENAFTTDFRIMKYVIIIMCVALVKTNLFFIILLFSFKRWHCKTEEMYCHYNGKRKAQVVYLHA